MYNSNTLPKIPTFSNLNPTMLGEELNKNNVLCFLSPDVSQISQNSCEK